MKSCNSNRSQNMHKVKLTQIRSPLSSPADKKNLQTCSAEPVRPVFGYRLSHITGLFEPGLSKDTDSPWGRDVPKHTTWEQTHDRECRHCPNWRLSHTRISWFQLSDRPCFVCLWLILIWLSMPHFMRTYFHDSVPLKHPHLFVLHSSKPLTNRLLHCKKWHLIKCSVVLFYVKKKQKKRGNRVFLD